MRLAQESSLAEDNATSESRRRLIKELNQIRKSAGDENGRESFNPPKPVRRKNAFPVETAAQDTGRQVSPAAAGSETSELASQLILLHFKGSEPADAGPRAIHNLLHSRGIAGTVFASDNIKSKAQLKELIKFLRLAGGASQPIIAIREIGGGSDGLPAIKDFEQWPSEKDIAANGDPEYAYSTYRSMGATLAYLGFNMNFGPIVTAPVEGKNASYGDNALQTGVFAKTFILGHREENVIPVPIVDGSDLAVRAVKTLLVSYPGTPVASRAGMEKAPPFPAFEGLLRGARFCFLTVPPGNGVFETASNINKGCDVLVLDGGAENPALVRDRAVQGISEAIKRNELTLDTLNAAVQRLNSLRVSFDPSGESRKSTASR